MRSVNARAPSINSANADESERLLPSESTEESTTTTTTTTTTPKRRWVTEPLVVLFGFCFMCQSGALPQYIYYRVGLVYNVTGDDGRTAFVCNASAGEDPVTELVQSEASRWSAYRTAVAYGTALLMVPLYSSASDFIGRRPAMVLPCVGSLADSVACALVSAFDLPLWLLVASAGLSGVGGGFGSLFAGVFAYIADTTSKEQRPIRVSIVEALFGLTATVAQLLVGWLIRLCGYTVPLAASALSGLAALAYALGCVPETRRSSVRLSGCRAVLVPLRGIVDLFRIGRRTTIVLLLLLASLGGQASVFMGSQSVLPLYEMNAPFCLDSVLIGYLGTARIVALQVGITLALLTMRRALGCVGLAALGLASGVASFVVTAVAPSTFWLFVACAVGGFSFLPMPMFRSHLSQLLPLGRQGALYSCIGVLEVAGNLVGSLTLVLMYRATLYWLPGFVFLAAAGVMLVGLILTCVCWALESRRGWGPTLEVAEDE